MNVVMPTAMVTMHQNEEQSASSKKTAQRGIRVWKALKTFPESIANAQAIRAVATAGKDTPTDDDDDDDDDDMVDAKLVEVRNMAVLSTRSTLANQKKSVPRILILCSVSFFF